MTTKTKKKYYQPPDGVTKIRHRLADGVPTHMLLHYMHDRDDLPTDVRDLAESAERLDQVRSLLGAVRGSTAPRELGNGASESRGLLLGEEIGAAIDEIMKAIRQVLVVKTMQEVAEEKKEKR